jgi:agmatine deiminase
MKYSWRFLTAILPLILFHPIPPALAEKDVDGLEELLPHAESPRERLFWLGREDARPAREGAADPPPVGPLRNCAEWEPCRGVLIRYPLGLPYDLLRDLDDDVTLHVVVASTYLATAQTNLAANGVDMAKVLFLVKPNDSIWTRDYGPWFVFDGLGHLVIINHVYNRPWRPNDNLIPIYFGEQQGLPIYSHDMYHTGGNYMTDGAHISASTRLVYDEAASENGMSAAAVDQLMAEYYGVTTYDVLEYIESGGIHHIDTWAKFLDEETVLVKEVWSSHWTYDTLNQRAVLLASLPASTGRNYQVTRVYCHDLGGSQPASYTNSLILNDRIYVPLFGDAAHDAAALAAYEAAAPGYAVKGYSYGGWLTDDALHCRAKGIMDRGMLRVQHIPIREPRLGATPVMAVVTAHSDSALTAVDLFYRQGGGDWQTLSMNITVRDTFAAVIPEPPAETTTDYYILAADRSGRQEGVPRVAPAHWYSFAHGPDLTPVSDARSAPAAIVHGGRPNPFNPVTRFSFELLHADEVTLDVYDLGGRRVRVLVRGCLGPGLHEYAWDGRDGHGRALPSGAYVFRLRAAGLHYTCPVTLLK